MAEEVSVIFNAVDNVSSAITGIRGAILTMNQAVQLAQQAYQAVNSVIQATVGTFVTYADSVRTLSQLTNTSTESTSRLVTVTDRYNISVSELEMASKKLATQGLSLTVDTIAKLSDQYLKLNTGAERQAFLTQNLGRATAQWTDILSQGSATILANNDAVSKSLVLDQKGTDAVHAYEMAGIDLANSWKGLAISAGEYLLPWMQSEVDYINLSITGWMQYLDWLNRNKTAMSDLKEYGPTLDELTRKAKEYGPTVKEMLGGTLNFLDALGTAQNTGFLNWLKEAKTNTLALDKVIADPTPWEQMYDGAKNATDRSSSEMSYLESSIKGMGADGATIWNGYLAATGQITPTAMIQFAKLEAFLSVEIPKIQSYIARGMSLSNVIAGLTADLNGAGLSGGGGGGGGGGGQHSASSYDTGQKNQYGEMWYDPGTKTYFSKKASGGPFAGWGLIGDAQGGGYSPNEELVYAPGGAKVYTADETRRMLSHAGGGYIAPPPPAYTLAPPNLPSAAAEAAADRNMWPGPVQTWVTNDPRNNIWSLSSPSSGGSSSGSSGGSSGGTSSAVTQALSSVSSGATTVATAASTISDSSSKTTIATQQAAAQASAGNAQLISEMHGMRMEVNKMMMAMPRYWSQAAAKVRKS